MLEGSADGKTWAEVDRHALDKPFENATRRRPLNSPPRHRSVSPGSRLLRPIGSFQVAEISLAGTVKPSPPVAGDGYRRDLNLMQGVAHTSISERV